MLISNIVTDWLSAQFQKIMLWIDSVIYWAVSMVYQLFIKLATIRLFDNEFFGDFANRIYAILGVFMLFYLAYALLNALINPDKLTGDKGVSKVASNLVISLILLGLIPTIFDYAYRIQNYILSSNLIGAIILNTSTTNPNNTETETGAETARNEEAMVRFGDSMAFVVMNAFINPDNYNVYMADDYTWFNFKADVLERSDYSALNGLGDATVYAQNEVGNENRTDVVVDYYVVISTLVGGFLLYVIISFTLDLGVRVIKFAFCQLVAPIPIIMRAMPGKKSTFDKWLKMTLSIYFEVFVRVAIMYIAVYFIQAIVTTEDIFAQFTGLQGKIALVIIILGIFAFAKQAPKMLSDMLGIESGNMKLGIGEKLKASGFLGAAIGGFGGSLVGAATGGIGGAAVSLFNGAGLSGFRLGAMNGWKNKGMQFGKQRKDIYSTLTGDYKNSPGWFGGSSLYDRFKAASKDYMKNKAKDRRIALEDEFEKPIIDEREAQFNREKNRSLSAAQQEFASAENAFNAKKNRELIDLQNQFNQEKDAFEQNKTAKLNELKMKKIRAETVDHDIMKTAEINREIESLTNSQYSNSKLEQEISNLASSTFSSTAEAMELQGKIDEINRATFDRKAESAKIQADYKERKEKELRTRAERVYKAQVDTDKRLGEEKATSEQKKAFETVLKDLGYKKEDKK